MFFGPFPVCCQPKMNGLPNASVETEILTYTVHFINKGFKSKLVTRTKLQSSKVKKKIRIKIRTS